MKKITITNAYTWYNKGDAGILLGIVETLKRVYNNDVEFTILSFTPEEDRKRYCKDKTIKEVYSNILNPHPYKHTKLGKIIAICKLFLKMIKTQIILKFNFEKNVNKDKTLKALKDSDIIVVCGGGFLGGKKFDSLEHLYQIFVNTKFGKPVYLMGTSIEQINNKIIKYYTEKKKKKLDYIFARETITEKYLSEFMPKNKYTLIPDMAFMLECANNKNFPFLNELKSKSKMLVGITVRNWNFPNVSNKENAKINYINQMKNFIEHYIEKENAIFIFIPQVIVSYASDTDVAMEIRNKMKEKCKKNFIIRDDDWSPLEIKTLIGNLDFFVGTRMHSNIFATSMYIPTLAIAYEKKTNGIMETVGQEKYIEEIDSIDFESMKTKFNDLMKNKEKIQKELKKARNKITNDILYKTEKILK